MSSSALRRDPHGSDDASLPDTGSLVTSPAMSATSANDESSGRPSIPRLADVVNPAGSGFVHASALFSPAHSSSSIPSSSNLEEEGLSDVSSLDGLDYEFVDGAPAGSGSGSSSAGFGNFEGNLPRPPSALSGRSSIGVGTRAGSAPPTRPNNPSLVSLNDEPDEGASAQNLALSSAFTFVHPEFRRPLPSTDGDEARRVESRDIDAVETSLGSTHQMFRAPRSSLGPSTSGGDFESTPHASRTIAPVTSDLSAALPDSPPTARAMRMEVQAQETAKRLSHATRQGGRGSGGPNSSSAGHRCDLDDSGFEFPDPLVDSSPSSEQDSAPLRPGMESQSPGSSSPRSHDFSLLSDSDIGCATAPLRNAWRPTPSTRSRGATSDGPQSHRAGSRAPTESIMASDLAPSQMEAGVGERSDVRDVIGTDEGAIPREPFVGSAQLNVFYVGRKLVPHVLRRISGSIRASLLRHTHTRRDDDGKDAVDGSHGFETRAQADLGGGYVSFSESHARLANGNITLLREYDATLPIGFDADATLAVNAWLGERGRAEIHRAGGLVVCLLERGEQPPLELSLNLGALLKASPTRAGAASGLHARATGDDSGSRTPVVRLLPVLCPRAPSNVDDGDADAANEGQHTPGVPTRGDDDGDEDFIAARLSCAFHLRDIQRHWRRTLLLADVGPGGAIDVGVKPRWGYASSSQNEGVVAFEQLLNADSACFGGDAGWAAQAATDLARDPAAPLVGGGPTSPPWLTRTLAWLRASDSVDVEQQRRSGVPTVRAPRASSAQPSASRAMAAALSCGLDAGETSGRAGRPSASDAGRGRGSGAAWRRGLRQGRLVTALVVVLSLVVALASMRVQRSLPGQGSSDLGRTSRRATRPRRGPARDTTISRPSSVALMVPPASIQPLQESPRPLSAVPKAPRASGPYQRRPDPRGHEASGGPDDGRVSPSFMEDKGGRTRTSRARRDALTTPLNRSLDLPIHHFFDVNAMVAQKQWLSLPVATTAAVVAMRQKDDALQALRSAWFKLHRWVSGPAKTALGDYANEARFWWDEVRGFGVHVVAPGALLVGRGLDELSRYVLDASLPFVSFVQPGALWVGRGLDELSRYVLDASLPFLEALRQAMHELGADASRAARRAGEGLRRHHCVKRRGKQALWRRVQQHWSRELAAPARLRPAGSDIGAKWGEWRGRELRQTLRELRRMRGVARRWRMRRVLRARWAERRGRGGGAPSYGEPRVPVEVAEAQR